MENMKTTRVFRVGLDMSLADDYATIQRFKGKGWWSGAGGGREATGCTALEFHMTDSQSVNDAKMTLFAAVKAAARILGEAGGCR